MCQKENAPPELKALEEQVRKLEHDLRLQSILLAVVSIGGLLCSIRIGYVFDELDRIAQNIDFVTQNIQRLTQSIDLFTQLIQ